MPIDTDFHSHVSQSSVLQMAQAAAANGLCILGLSEHVFQMREARSLLDHLRLEGPMLDFASYIEAVRAAGQETSCEVRLGMEVDFIPALNEQIQALLQGYDWDFLIGSVHQIDDLQFETNLKLTREQGEALWLRYLALLRQAVSSGYFSLVSHPVRMRVGNPFLPASIDEELERLAAEAAHSDVALEINGYDVLTYPNMVRRLVRACAAQHTPISVGSDAHIPRQTARAHSQSKAILREAGINMVRIWKQRKVDEYKI